MIEAAQVPDVGSSETRNGAISFAAKLDSGELLTGTPTVAELTSSDLTISNVAVSTAILTINGSSVPIGEAVQFTVSGQTAGTTYRLKATATSDASAAQTLTGIVVFRARDDTT